MSQMNRLPKFDSARAVEMTDERTATAWSWNTVSKLCGAISGLFAGGNGRFGTAADSEVRAAASLGGAVGREPDRLSSFVATQAASRRGGVNAVQGELALASIKVVRNDLAAEDIEVIAPARERRDMTIREPTVSVLAGVRGARGMTWNRLTARLFVADRARLL